MYKNLSSLYRVTKANFQDFFFKNKTIPYVLQKEAFIIQIFTNPWQWLKSCCGAQCVQVMLSVAANHHQLQTMCTGLVHNAIKWCST